MDKSEILKLAEIEIALALFYEKQVHSGTHMEGSPGYVKLNEAQTFRRRADALRALAKEDS